MRRDASKLSPLFEITRMFVRLDHIARRINFITGLLGSRCEPGIDPRKKKYKTSD